MRKKGDPIKLSFNHILPHLDIDNAILDSVAVHELTHRLWDVVRGRTYKNIARDNFVEEGYATYGESRWFSDFYSSGKFELENELPVEYKRGRTLIQKLVDKHGEDILLEIPKKSIKYND